METAPITPGTNWVRYPSLLSLSEPKLLAYPPETAIAEKFEAMVVLDLANTRLKDFFDIWFLAEHRDFDGATLHAALRATFRRRRTDLPTETPSALTDAFHDNKAKRAQWRSYLRKARVKDAPNLDLACKRIEALIMPVIKSLVQDESFELRWAAGGAWERD